MFSETSVAICQSKLRHVPEDSTVHGHRYEHLGSRISGICFGAEVGVFNLWLRKIHTLRCQVLGTVPVKRKIWWASYVHSCTSLLRFPLFFW